MTVAEPWELPAHWRWSRFDGVARVASNLVDPATYGAWAHVAPNHIESETGRLLPYSTVAEDGVTSSKHKFHAGQVLYSKIRPYLAKVVLVDFDGLCSADMYPLDTELEPRFLKWWMLTREFTRQAAGEQARTVLPKINTRSLNALPVPVPPLDEQRRIVDLLEDHLSRLDAAALWIDHARTRLMSAKQASMDAAVAIHEEPRSEVAWAESRLECWQRAGRKGTPPDPATPNLDSAPPWTGVVSLEAVTDADRLIRYGILMPRVADGVGTVPYIEVKDLRGHTLDGKLLRKTSSELDHQFAGARVRPGDVVMAVRGSYDRSAAVPEGFAGTNLSRDVARIAPLPGLSPEYLQAWLQSSFSRRYLAEHARGVAVKGINIATLRSLPIVVPSAGQQERAVVRLDMQLSGLNRIDTQLASALLRASALRRALLAAAFAGALNRRAEFMEGTNV